MKTNKTQFGWVVFDFVYSGWRLNKKSWFVTLHHDAKYSYHEERNSFNMQPTEWWALVGCVYFKIR